MAKGVYIHGVMNSPLWCTPSCDKAYPSTSVQQGQGHLFIQVRPQERGESHYVPGTGEGLVRLRTIHPPVPGTLAPSASLVAAGFRHLQVIVTDNAVICTNILFDSTIARLEQIGYTTHKLSFLHQPRFVLFENGRLPH